MPTIRATARLTDDSGLPLSGKQINFYLNDNLFASAWTDSNGIATADVVVDPGTYTVRAEFPGDELYEPSSDVKTVTVGGGGGGAPGGGGGGAGGGAGGGGGGGVPSAVVVIAIVLLLLLLLG